MDLHTPHFTWSFPPGTHYKCRRCGNCCRFPNVFLWPQDIANINRILVDRGLGGLVDEFYDEETRRIHKADGKCMFLMGESICAIYPGRPLYCRAFPFKLVDPEKGLIELENYEFCEGVHKGKVKRSKLLELDPYLKELQDLEKVITQR